jgi:Fur family peroxide stress response transcriptional regulator
LFAWLADTHALTIRFGFVRTPAELTTTFRANGLKVTPQRQLLFRLLHDNTTHPTAEGLFATASQLMPGISLRTVYQTLNDLAAMGELQVLQFSGGPTRFDPNVDDHHHAKCDAAATCTTSTSPM